MKTQAYGKLLDQGDVIVYKKTKIEMPMEKIIGKNFCSSEVYGRNIYLYRTLQVMKEDVDDIYYSSARRHRSSRLKFSRSDIKVEIPLKTGKDVKKIDGIIAYNSLKSLAKFLVKNLDLKTQTYITDIITDCRNINGKVDRNILYERLSEKINHDDGLSAVFFRIRDTEEVRPRNTFGKYCSNGQIYLVRKNENRGEQYVFVREIFREINGYKIPRCEYIYFGYAALGRDKMSRVVVTMIDGKLKTYEDINDINPGILDKLDETADFYAGTFIDLLPDRSKKVMAILRVPTKQEYLKYRKEPKKNIAPRPVTDSVYFIEPSQRATEIPESVKVIDDIGIFEHIMSRMATGIYIPGNTPFNIDPDLLKDKEEFLLLMQPA